MKASAQPTVSMTDSFDLQHDFSGFYQGNLKGLKRYLQRLGASPVIAEDLAQEAMISAWVNAKSYQKNKACTRTWLYRIAHNAFIDHCRRSTVRYNYRQRCEPESSVEPAHEEHQQVQKLQRCIKRLPRGEAQTVYAHYFLDKSHGEIAREYALPLGSVKSQLRLAKERLGSWMSYA